MSKTLSLASPVEKDDASVIISSRKKPTLQWSYGQHCWLKTFGNFGLSSLAVMGALSRKDMGLIWGCGFTFILSAKHSNSNNWEDSAKSTRRFSAVGSAEGDRTSFLNKRRKLTGPDSMKFRRFSKSAEFQAPGYSFLVVRVLEP